MSAPRHPEVVVELSGHDGNAFAVIGAVLRAMEAAGVPREEMSAFIATATAGNYDELIQTCMRWVDVR